MADVESFVLVRRSKVDRICSWLEYGIIIQDILHHDVGLDVNARLGLCLYIISIFRARLISLRIVI